MGKYTSQITIIPATPGWYFCITDEDGTMHEPIAAWCSGEKDGVLILLPMINNHDGQIEAIDGSGDLVYSPLEIPEDQAAEG
jgi:hypothetical protein